MKLLITTIILLLAFAMASCSDRKEPETTTQRVEIEWVADFTTSVKRQLEKEDILKAFYSASKITVQLVWSDKDASENGMIMGSNQESRDRSNST